MKLKCKFLLTFSLITSLFTLTLPLAAEELPFKKITCSEFDNTDELISFAFWLDGYFSGAAQKQLMDEKSIELILEKTVATCQSNPEKAVFQIISDLKS
ncbi:HdeA/HdeB family chaperone [Kiloniella sp.]|uniref:HdeA/HdeB family chaperone n=1 Tax=Kiloniella sp. TaxID=1938587 RepID=UPI003A8EB863